MKIMAVDAGFAGLGVVVVEDATVVFASAFQTKRTDVKRGVRVADDDAERCREITRYLTSIIKEHRPGGLVVELPSGAAKGARANRAMGMASAIVAAVVEFMELPVEYVTPLMVKKAAVGNGSATKIEVQEAVKQALAWHVDYDLIKMNGWMREHVADAAGAYLAARHGNLVKILNNNSGSVQL